MRTIVLLIAVLLLAVCLTACRSAAPAATSAATAAATAAATTSAATTAAVTTTTTAAATTTTTTAATTTTTTAPPEETASAESFPWKGYEMCFPCMTTDMEGYGIKDFQGAIALVRLAPTEGTFAEKEFRQQMFELEDPDGNVGVCKFYIVPDSSTNSVTGIINTAPEQPYIELLFEMADPTPERLAASTVIVCEDEDAESLRIPLKEVSQEVEKPEKK